MFLRMKFLDFWPIGEPLCVRTSRRRQSERERMSPISRHFASSVAAVARFHIRIITATKEIATSCKFHGFIHCTLAENRYLVHYHHYCNRTAAECQFSPTPSKKKSRPNQEVNQLANMQSWLDRLTDWLTEPVKLHSLRFGTRHGSKRFFGVVQILRCVDCWERSS